MVVIGSDDIEIYNRFNLSNTDKSNLQNYKKIGLNNILSQRQIYLSKDTHFSRLNKMKRNNLASF